MNHIAITSEAIRVMHIGEAIVPNYYFAHTARSHLVLSVFPVLLLNNIETFWQRKIKSVHRISAGIVKKLLFEINFTMKS